MIWLILASLLTRILTLIEYRGISFVRPNLAVCVAIGLKIVDTKGTIYVKMICILTLRWNIQMFANKTSCDLLKNSIELGSPRLRYHVQLRLYETAV